MPQPHDSRLAVLRDLGKGLRWSRPDPVRP
jgi:hypothetical protein